MVNTDAAVHQPSEPTNADLIQRLYASLPAILVNLTIMPLVVVVIMWDRVSHLALSVWFLSALAVLIGRFTLARLYARRRPPPGQALRWARYFTASSLVSGFTWGFAGWAFFVPGQAPVQVFLYVCIIGLAAGSIIVTSYWLPAYYAYAIPSVGISAARLMAEGGLEYIGLAALMLMYLAIITRVARIQNRSAVEVSALRFANLDLVAQLRNEKEAVEQANRELDLRVQERTAELQAEIGERRKAEARLDKLAHHDPLTGLPNRLMFSLQLDRRIEAAASGGRQMALMFIDLDRFKEVNDTLGHTIGDKLLIAVARRLESQRRECDALARLGGDEFVYILEDIRDASEADATAAKLIELLARPFVVAEHEFFISGSIGICLFPRDGHDVDTLVRNADTAMFHAKEHGRGRSHFYSPEMTVHAQERTRIESLLRRAIAANELEVHYQIKVDAAGRPTGAEALLRWRSKVLGSVPPVRFIPLAEETGFIVALGEWVLRQACRQTVAWRAEGVVVPKVSVNLSIKQIECSDVVAMVDQVLTESGLEPAALELEITESTIMNTEDALSVLKRLSDLGVKLAVDDFGTGYSSMAYLKLLPIDTLKIDRSFVEGIGEGSQDVAIIRTVIALARSMGFATVAEGVETERQYSFLAAEGCDEIQGYLFGWPQPAEQFAMAWREKQTQALSMTLS